MNKWYVDDNDMIRLDDVTFVKKSYTTVSVRHGLDNHWDIIQGKGQNKQQVAESVEKIYKTIQEILMKPIDK